MHLIIGYDATEYGGWDCADSVCVREVLQAQLERILGCLTPLKAAIHTGPGVHAESQIVRCTVSEKTNLVRLHRSLNQLLPADIHLFSVEKEASISVLEEYHSWYEYTLFCSQVESPFYRRFSWHCPSMCSSCKMAVALSACTKLSGMYWGYHEEGDLLRLSIRGRSLSEKSILAWVRAVVNGVSSEDISDWTPAPSHALLLKGSWPG